MTVAGRNELAELGQAFNRMAAQLEQANQKQQELESLRRELIAWVGHDLRTPLASLRAIVEALADGVVDDPTTRQRYLQTAQRDILSLSLLIDNLFEITRLDTEGLRLEQQLNSLSDLISDTIESFSQLAGQRGISLGGAVAPGVDPVSMDAQYIGRLLNNLVGNAIRHTGAGGRVQLHAWPVARGIQLEVSDTGEGIAAADLPHVFERFYRGERARSPATGGAGLGLAIARSIVEAHGGQIGVESQEGEGTCFFVTLPKG